VLSDRLRTLVAAGVLERRDYQDRGSRTRQEYRLTPAGRELQLVLTALRQWGDRYLAGPDGPPVLVTHAGCGGAVRVQHVCAAGHALGDTGRGMVASTPDDGEAEASPIPPLVPGGDDSGTR
jgi:hypothetical protein